MPETFSAQCMLIFQEWSADYPDEQLKAGDIID